jgi:hypothetical protein
LRDVQYFNQVGILFGAVTWPHEQDIAPEILLEEMIPAESCPLISKPKQITKPQAALPENSHEDLSRLFCSWCARKIRPLA